MMEGHEIVLVNKSCKMEMKNIVPITIHLW